MHFILIYSLYVSIAIVIAGGTLWLLQAMFGGQSAYRNTPGDRIRLVVREFFLL